jgi:hypothetical protein
MDNVQLNNHAARRAFLAAITRAAVAAAVPTASGGPLSCYRKVRLAVPAAGGVTVVLMDTTTPVDNAAAGSLDALLSRVLRHKGERLLLATFAGLAPVEHPRIVAEVYQEPSPDDRFSQTQVIEKTETLGNCLPRLWTRNLKSFKEAVRASMQGGPAAAGTYSEIAFALRWAVTDIVPALTAAAHPAAVRIIMFSDGFLHSRTGQSFYRNGRVRPIVAARELEVLKKSGLVPAPTVPSVKFDLYWIAMGAQPEARKDFADPADFDALVNFWGGAARLYGARDAWLGLTVRAEVIK